MCLTVPGRIVRIEADDPQIRLARVDFGGVERIANLLYTPEAHEGDYVIVQAGFATRRLAEAEALEALEYHRQLDELSRSSSSASPAATPRRTPSTAT
jgi:hydrogenase expression/formation protein HypC